MDSEFPLRLNIPRSKYLELRLKTSEEELNHYILNQKKYVKPIELKRIKNGKLKIRIVYDTPIRYKTILRNINNQLLIKHQFPNGVLGGIPGKCIKDLALRHCTHEAIYSIDLKEFFPNIKSPRVEHLFRRTGCSPQVSSLLTRLVTFEGKLPQGFPTSTMIANWIAYDLDVLQLKICNENGITRSRWVDDIVFSGRIRDLDKVTSILNQLVRSQGFKINTKKIEYHRRNIENSVLGLNVNSNTPRVPQVVISKLDSFIEIFINYGESLTRVHFPNDFTCCKDVLRSIKGSLNYVKQFNEKDFDRLNQKLRNMGKGG